MHTAQDQPPTSFLTRIVRWIGDFERAIETRPVDNLALRVADLERRIADLDDHSADGAREI